jgi:hypothetical protein
MSQLFIDICTFFLLGLFIISLIGAIGTYFYVMYLMSVNNARKYLENDIEKNFIFSPDQFEEYKNNFSEYKNNYW